MNGVKTAIAVGLAFVAGAGTMWTQGRPQTRREPQFENEYVRVWKSTIFPKQPLTLHRHDHGRALISLNGGKLDVVDSTGRVLNTYNWARGKAYWLDADPPGATHADVNNGARPIEVIVVELKKDR
jgi:hypothetical protein